MIAADDRRGMESSLNGGIDDTESHGQTPLEGGGLGSCRFPGGCQFAGDLIETLPGSDGVVLDECTRECLALEVSRKFTSDQFVERLMELFAMRRIPEFIRSDNEPIRRSTFFFDSAFVMVRF